MKLATWLSTANIFPQKTNVIDMFFTESFSKRKKEIFQMHHPLEIFRKLKNVGVEGMELVVIRSTTDNEINAMRQLCQEADFPIFSVHQPLTNVFSISLGEITRLFEIAHSFSAHIIVLHINAVYKGILNKHFVKKLKQLESKYSIAISIENMPKSIFFRNMKAIWEPKGFASLIEQKGFKITLDTTHLGEVKGNLLGFYKINRHSIVNIHISDYKHERLRSKLSLTSGRHLALGDGELPINEFLRILKKDEYKGLITMEINSSLEKLLDSAKMINNIIKT